MFRLFGDGMRASSTSQAPNSCTEALLARLSKYRSCSLLLSSPVAAWPDHGPPQLAQDRPSRFVAAQTQNTLQSQGADAALLIGDEPHRSKQTLQGQVAVQEDGAGNDRYFVPATAAEPAISPNLPSLPSFPSSVSPRGDAPIGAPDALALYRPRSSISLRPLPKPPAPPEDKLQRAASRVRSNPNRGSRIIFRTA